MHSTGFVTLALLLCIGCGTKATRKQAGENLVVAPSEETKVEASTLPVSPAEPIVSPVGRFALPHKVIEICEGEGECEEEQTDTLSVRWAKEGADSGPIEVELQLYFDFEHECTFEGTLAQVDSVHWKGPHNDSAEGEEACHLSLVVVNGRVDLSSEDCRDFCGARGSMEASFTIP